MTFVFNGTGGGQFVDSAVEYDVEGGRTWFAFCPLTDSVIEEIGPTTGKGAIVDIVGETIPAGLVIYGDFTHLKLTSGTGILYLR